MDFYFEQTPTDLCYLDTKASQICFFQYPVICDPEICKRHRAIRKHKTKGISQRIKLITPGVFGGL